MPVKRIPFYIMRHGQSLDNHAGLISGAGSDPHLTLKGYKQAEIASLAFTRLTPKPTKIVSSGLVRAHMTAKIVTGVVEIIQDPDLNERHLGELDGKISEIEQKSMKVLPGEETSTDHAARVLSSLNRHLEEEDLVLVVCHGGSIRRILEALNLAGAMEVENARIYKFEPHDDVWRVTII